MHGTQVRLCIEVHALDVYLIHTDPIVVHDLVQTSYGLLRQRVHQLDTLEVMLGNLLSFVLLVESILFGFTLDEIEELFVALQVDLVPSSGHFGPLSLGCGLMPSPAPLLLGFARALMACVFGAVRTLTLATFTFILIFTSIVIIFVIVRVICLGVHLLLLNLIETALHCSLCRLELPLNTLLVLILAEDLRKLHSLANRFEHVDDFKGVVWLPFCIGLRRSAEISSELVVDKVLVQAHLRIYLHLAGEACEFILSFITVAIMLIHQHLVDYEQSNLRGAFAVLTNVKDTQLNLTQLAEADDVRCRRLLLRVIDRRFPANQQKPDLFVVQFGLARPI